MRAIYTSYDSSSEFTLHIQSKCVAEAVSKYLSQLCRLEISDPIRKLKYEHTQIIVMNFQKLHLTVQGDPNKFSQNWKATASTGICPMLFGG